MRFRKFALGLTLTLVLVAGPGPVSQSLTAETAAESAAGYWDGAIEIPGVTLGVRVTLSNDGDAGVWSGTADIPQQGATGLPLAAIVVEGTKVRFQLGGVAGEPTFAGTLAGDTLAGTFSQSGQAFPFELTRTDPPAPSSAASRSSAATEEPVGEPLSVETEVGRLHGTLLVPEGEGPFPVGLIVAGSGPTDRDGNNSMVPGRNDSLKKLAELLQAHGIAALRYDKRGVGESAAAIIPEADLRFRNVIEDVAAWVPMLREDKRFGKIAILGHSEGSLAGMIAARETDVDVFVSLAGPGEPIDVVLNRQLAPQPEQIREPAKQILSSLRKGEQVKEFDPALNVLFRPSIQPYLISWIRLDPAIEIAKLKIPTLIVQGATDLQVGLEQGAALRKGRPDARYLEVPKMNHVFKEAPADPMANQAAYTDPDLPLARAFAEGLISYFREVLLEPKK